MAVPAVSSWPKSMSGSSLQPWNTRMPPVRRPTELKKTSWSRDTSGRDARTWYSPIAETMTLAPRIALGPRSTFTSARTETGAPRGEPRRLPGPEADAARRAAPPAGAGSRGKRARARRARGGKTGASRARRARTRTPQAKPWRLALRRAEDNAREKGHVTAFPRGRRRRRVVQSNQKQTLVSSYLLFAFFFPFSKSPSRLSSSHASRLTPPRVAMDDDDGLTATLGGSGAAAAGVPKTETPGPPREEMVANAVAFLRHPQVATSPEHSKRAFLEKKGLNEPEIAEAFRRVSRDKKADAADAADAKTRANGASEPTSAKTDEKLRWTQVVARAGAAVAAVSWAYKTFRPKHDSPGSNAPPPPPPPLPSAAANDAERTAAALAQAVAAAEAAKRDADGARARAAAAERALGGAAAAVAHRGRRVHRGGGGGATCGASSSLWWRGRCGTRRAKARTSTVARSARWPRPRASRPSASLRTPPPRACAASSPPSRRCSRAPRWSPPTRASKVRETTGRRACARTRAPLRVMRLARKPKRTSSAAGRRVPTSSCLRAPPSRARRSPARAARRAGGPLHADARRVRRAVFRKFRNTRRRRV